MRVSLVRGVIDIVTAVDVMVSFSRRVRLDMECKIYVQLKYFARSVIVSYSKRP